MSLSALYSGMVLGEPDPDPYRNEPDDRGAFIPTIVRYCGCGAEHAAEGWARLQYVGEINDGVERLELRNCRCGSSIAIILEVLDLVALAAEKRMEKR